MSIWYPFLHGEQVKINSMFSLFQYYYKKGYCFAGESHDFWECVYVLDGEIQASGDERVYHLSKGQIIFHKPMELHKFLVTSENGTKLMIFSFTLEGKISTYLMNKVFSLTDEQQKILSDILKYAENKMVNTYIPPELSESQRYFSPSLKSEIYLQRIVFYLYQLFLSLADNGSITESLSTPEAELFKKAIRYMLTHIDEQLTIPVISKYCNVSESGLKRVFSKYAGMSVHKYFLNLKLNAAAKMIQSGKNVTEVSETLNFSSQSYFSVSFRRVMGKTPSEFKESFIKSQHT